MKINISFNEWSKDRLRSGDKVATSRTKIYGVVGDTFIACGKTFVLVGISQKRLGVVAKDLFHFEGAKNTEEFIEVWKSIHPKKGFRPEEEVFFHVFEEVKK